MNEYKIEWHEFWWDDDRDCGYLSDYTSRATFKADTPEAAYALWLERGASGDTGKFRPENGALEIVDGLARWELVEPVFVFGERVVDVDSGTVHYIPHTDKDDDSLIRNVIDFYYGLYSGHLEPFGYGRGQSAVEDYVRAHHPEIRWHYCLPCDSEEPTFGPACLVCGNIINLALTNADVRS